MQPTVIVVTVVTAGTRVQVQSAYQLCTKVFMEAQRANTGHILIGNSAVAVGGTGLITDLNIPSGNAILDRYYVEDTQQGNSIDISSYWIDSTASGDKVRVTFWVN